MSAEKGMPPEPKGSLNFARHKLMRVWCPDKERLLVRGILEDDIYGLGIDVTVGLPQLELLSIEGRWDRKENSECPRAIPFLQEAIGFCVDDGFAARVQKSIARKACRHFANLLVECGHAAREAARFLAAEEGEAFPKAAGAEDVTEQKADTVQTPKAAPVIRGKRAEIRNAPNSAGTVIDLHVHSFPASACSIAAVDDLIVQAKRIGLNGICLTDHNYVWDPEALEALRRQHNFLVLGGTEITTDQGDMLVFGYNRPVKGIISLKDLRAEVLKAGGFMAVAHPFRGFLTFGIGWLGLSLAEAMQRPLFKQVDGVEVLNGKVSEKENRFTAQVAEGLGLAQTGGSDAHTVSDVGRYATRFDTAITDEKGLVAALKQGNFSPVALQLINGIQTFSAKRP